MIAGVHMKTKILRSLMLAAVVWHSGLHAEIIVDPEVIKTFPKEAVTVRAQRSTIYQLGTFEEGEALGVEVSVLNEVYKDISIYFVDAANMTLARQNLPFTFVDVTKKNAPFRLMFKVTAPGPYYLVIDNRFANVIDKKVVYQLAFVKHLSNEQIQAQKADFEKAYTGLKQTFDFKDFNIRIGPCGQVNAFSTTETGDVTICSEIINELSGRPGALIAVILHELGHTLLNLWGLPNFANEDDADQFATIMLLRSGQEGKQALYEWMQVYAEQDSRAQAANMLIAGDTHSLSVQRIRNIQASMKNSADLMSRWNNVLYPHMTSDTLKAIIANPAPYDNPAAATRELAKR